MEISPFRLSPPPMYFVGRMGERKAFERLIENAVGGNDRSMAVVGDRGIGKTALLEEFTAIAKKKGCVVARLELHEGVKTLGYFSIAIIDAVQKELQILSLKEKAKSKLMDAMQAIQLKYQGVEFSMKKPDFKAMPELDLFDNLKEIWVQLDRAGVPAVVIEIDEAERLEYIEGSLTFLKNTFQKLYQEQCNYVVVLAGKMGIYKKIEEIHSPIGRFFPPTELKPLSLEDTRAYVYELMERRSRLHVTQEAIQALQTLSDGNPFALNAICDVLYEHAKDSHNIVDKDFIELFRQELVAKAGSGLFEKRFNLLSETEKEILTSIVKQTTKDWIEKDVRIPEITTSEIAKLISKSSSYASIYADRLVEKECLIKNSRGKYSTPYVLFVWYVLMATGNWPAK